MIELDEALIKNAVSIDRSDLNTEYCKVSGHLDYFGHLYAKANAAYQNVKFDLKREEYKAFLVAKATVEGSRAGSQPSDKLCEAHAYQDADVIKLQEKLIEAQIELDRLKSVVDSIKTKRDMLVQLGAQMRKTMDFEPVVKSGEKIETTW